MRFIRNPRRCLRVRLSSQCARRTLWKRKKEELRLKVISDCLQNSSEIASRREVHPTARFRVGPVFDFRTLGEKRGTDRVSHQLRCFRSRLYGHIELDQMSRAGACPRDRCRVSILFNTLRGRERTKERVPADRPDRFRPAGRTEFLGQLLLTSPLKTAASKIKISERRWPHSAPLRNFLRRSRELVPD